MSNKSELKKEVTGTHAATMNDKSKMENPAPDRMPRKTKKRKQKSTVAQINAAERSAVNAVKPDASRTVRGSSGLANTGTIISYD